VRLLRCALVAGAVLAAAAPARANLRFEPVYIYLRPGEPATVLKLTNDGAAPTRYQATIYSWTQTPKGEMQLLPTRDLAYFPTVFVLGPGEQRSVRIGTTASFAAPEKTYRILVEELPSETAAVAKTRPGVQFQVRTTISLPIFVEPANPLATARIERVAAAGGVLDAVVRSTGNAHLHLNGVRIAALGPAGEVLHERKWGPSYLLASDELRLSEPLPAGRCGSVRSVRIEVQTDHGNLTEATSSPSGACVR
jgi:fimbrial chaperone protein